MADLTNKEYYKPRNKDERKARRRVWERYQTMKDDSIRKEEEKQWELGDKAYAQWMPEREHGDWRSHITLPDSFSATQAHMQESIDRRGRPVLKAVESSDFAKESLSNDVMKYNMDMTKFDFETYQAKNCAAIRGTAWMIERYKLEKRKVQMPDSIDDEGNIVYKEEEITDCDDTYTEWIDNDRLYWDPAATHEDKAIDMIEREVISLDEFKRVYGQRKDFMNVNKVPSAGAISENSLFFKRATDVTADDVEVLHYWNKSTDSYDVLANSVLVRMKPMPTKHKQLPGAVFRHYFVPGRLYGIGIPKAIYSLTEERSSLRNLNLDKQHLQTDKMFLVNDLIDIDEEEARTRPNGFIYVNTNGMPINQAVMPLEYGDTPMSFYRTEEQLLDDIRRAHGIDDRVQGVQTGGTATEAAILKEAAQKRISMVNTIADMDTMIRIGNLKWSNIQFFYPIPKIEKIVEDNEERTKKTYRKIRVEGREYKVVKGEGGNELSMSDIEGSSAYLLNKKNAAYINGDYDLVMTADTSAVLSKPLQQAKITEMFNTLLVNPATAAVIDPDKAARRYLQINDEDPKMWMRGKGLTSDQWKKMAQDENAVMSTGIPLLPTDGATQEHTEEHLNYMDSPAFEALPQAVQDIIAGHTFGEAEAQGAMPSGGGQGGSTPPPTGGISMTPNTPLGTNNQDTRVDASRGQ